MSILSKALFQLPVQLPRQARSYRRFWLPISAFILLSISVSTATLLLWQRSQANDDVLQADSPDIHPTAIPWLTSEWSCEQAGKYWEDEVCWDREHSPEF
ncbi:hypothetical protein [Leptolyngbya ohadii]|uniref:hypothetical protein n=1 Tax=Leptolyngbya ohadii TaxID=1962290 RepID=UPI0015C636A0|nr:hypothetical protein [Leptolyngbya ohadii]